MKINFISKKTYFLIIAKIFQINGTIAKFLLND